MDFIISFFRDTLDGPLYIVVSIICGILSCSCIGYLGEQYLKKKHAKKEFDSTHVTVSNTVSGVSNVAVSNTASAVSTTAVTSNVAASQGVVPVNNNGVVTSVNQNQ